MIIQLQNPKSGMYVKIDNDKGVILSYKKTPGPYKGIPIVYPKEESVVDSKEEVSTKTYFDFTYPCLHGGTAHCIECYNKAKGYK